MTYRTILTQALATPAGDRRVRQAAVLARKFGAHLIGAGVQAFIPYVATAGAYGYVDGAAVQAIHDELETELKEAERRFGEIAAGLPGGTTWRAALDYPTPTMARLTRSADLVIASRRDDAQPEPAAASAHDLVMECGRPVLVAPPGDAQFEAKVVLVAWKDSRESRRAVIDALPFLAAAERVVLLEICEGDEKEAASTRLDGVVEHLGRHGVKCVQRIEEKTRLPVSEAIVKFAVAEGSDLVVAGGYAHARMREWVLGGVTQDLLDGSPLFSLMSH